MASSPKSFAISILAAAALILGGCDQLDLPTDWKNLPGDSSSVAESYIVVFNDDVANTIVSDIASQLIGLAAPNLGEESRGIFTEALKGFVAEIAPADLAWLRLDPRVKYIEPNYRATLTPLDTWYDNASVQSTPWGIRKVGGARDGTGRRAWILDTGVDLYNTDLNVDRTLSRNFVYDGHRTANDGNGHGTHVAGIIGAKNNSIGVVGVAANASLVALRVLDDYGSGSYSSIIAGLDYVAANGRVGDVVNLSLGGPASRALDDAVRRVANRGIKVVVAAGNSGTNAGYTSPARVSSSNIYTVSAIDQYGRLARFSNYGSPVDVAAPGVAITSTRIGGGTLTMSGTSMAAPHVAGLLLFGTVRGYGYATNDPDGAPDPIAYR